MIRRVRLRGAVVFVLPLSVLGFCGLEGWGQGAVCILPRGASMKASITPFVSSITPGGVVHIKGCGFKDVGGQVILSGLKKFDNTPLPPVELGILQQGNTYYWSNTQIVAIIPDTITMVRDQPAKIQVIRPAVAPEPNPKQLRKSSELPVTFKAARQGKLLPGSDVQAFCSDAADNNWCNGIHHFSSSFCVATFGINEAGSAFGTHYTCTGIFDSEDDGSDIFQATLKNDWVFTGMDFTATTCQGNLCISEYLNPVGTQAGIPSGLCKAKSPTGYSNLSTSSVLTVKWCTKDNAIVSYNIFLSMEGPVGVPHK
jgi:hypothetical protein